MNPLFQQMAAMQNISTYAKYARAAYISAQQVHIQSNDDSARQMEEQKRMAEIQERIEEKKKEITAEQERVMFHGTSIQLTERIFNSAEFLEILNMHAEQICEKIRAALHRGETFDKELRGGIKLYREGKINGNYLLAQGTISWFKRSKLPASERRFIDCLFNLSLDMYRRRRNEAARINRKIRKYKKKLRDEGFEGEITVNKVPYGTELKGNVVDKDVAIEFRK